MRFIPEVCEPPINLVRGWHIKARLEDNRHPVQGSPRACATCARNEGALLARAMKVAATPLFKIPPLAGSEYVDNDRGQANQAPVR